MAQTPQRLLEEIVRLGGRCAHVRSESIDTKHDGGTGEAWLHGRFDYTLYRYSVFRIGVVSAFRRTRRQSG